LPTFVFLRNNVEIHRIIGHNSGQFFKYLKHHSSIAITIAMDEISKIRTNLNELYFESQKEALCGMHALNNALQFPLFKRNDLVSIANQLQISEENLNENQIDKNIYGDEEGNFNVDVLFMALKSKKINLKRFFLKEIECSFEFPSGMFIICNGTHWFALRKFFSGGPIWNLDSLLDRPVIFTEAEFSKFSKNQNNSILRLDFN
jgi:hypothetical protein